MNSWDNQPSQRRWGRSLWPINPLSILLMPPAVLLFPYANTEVLKESIYARDHLLTSLGREKLKIIYLEEFITFLEAECTGSPLEEYYRDFRAKYLL